MPLKLMTSDAFKAAAKGGARPDGAVFRLTTNPSEVVAGTDRTRRFVFSDPSIDLAGDSINQSGWETDSFNSNPVALFSHASWDPPIGRASNVGVKGDRLLGDIEFAAADVYPFAETIYRLINGGFLRGVSVGFIPLEYEFVNEKDRPFGINYTRQTLLEISICAIPCNPNALIEARSKGIDTQPMSDWASRWLDRGGQILIPRNVLEDVFKAAKTPHAVRRKYLAKDADWKVGAARDLPLDQSDGWDGAAAEASIFTHAGGENFNPEVAKKGFLVYDAAAPKLRGSYKEPFAHVVDGTLKAVKGGIKAAASRLPQANISETARSEARGVIDHYEKAFGMGDESGKSRRRAAGEAGDGGGSNLVGTDGDGDGPGNGVLPRGNCGRSKDEACGMKDESECAIHADPPQQEPDGKSAKAGRRLSAATKALLEAAMKHHQDGADSHAKAMDCIKAVLDGNEKPDDHVDPDGDGDDGEEKRRAKRQAKAKELRKELGLAAD